MKYELKANYDFDRTNSITPDMVMRDVCKDLNELTKGFVVGNVCEYNGNIESYDTLGAMAALTTSLQGVMRVDIQDKLGAIGDVNFKYELYLSANQIENYKYRILFVGYGISGYPVKVVVEQDIADELNDKEDSGYIYTVESKDDFEKLLISIFNSKTIQKVVQGLIIATNRKLLELKPDSEWFCCSRGKNDLKLFNILKKSCLFA